MVRLDRLYISSSIDECLCQFYSKIVVEKVQAVMILLHSLYFLLCNPSHFLVFVFK